MQKNPHKIDEILRQRLAELPTPPPSPAGWERLEVDLDQDPDFALRSALIGLAVSDDVAGWGALERKLDPVSQVDASIAEGLNALTPTAPVGSWELLSAKVDDAIGQEVDGVVNERLYRDTTGNTSGWAALAARLELISHRRHLVGAWKVTEVSLLLSLLLLFLRFGPETAGEYPTAPLTADDLLIAEATTTAQPSISLTNDLHLPAEAQSSSLANEPSAGLATQVALPEAPQKELVVIEMLPKINIGPVSTEVHELKQPLLIRVTPEVSDPLAGPDYTAEWMPTLPSPALALPEIDNSIPVRYRLNLFLAPGEINEVITPPNQVSNIDIAGRNQFTNSSSVGALLDISKGKDGLEIGAIYSRHAYTPTELIRPDCLVEGNCPEGYDRFIYHSISFPFSYERTLFSRNDWRIGARGGMAMSIITQSEFQLTESAREDLESSLLAPQGRASSGRSSGQNTISTRQVLDPEPGWFEGGSLLTNASFYLSGGFTVERFLTPRFSLYVSPTYSRVIYLDKYEGVGPYNDRIHRASLRFGSRFLLGGK